MPDDKLETYIPPTEQIRERLSNAVCEAALLRQLLRVATKRDRSPVVQRRKGVSHAR